MPWFLPRVDPGLLGAALLLCGASPFETAAAAPDEAAAMGDFFKGALEIDVPAGNWTAKRYFAPDHTYRDAGSDGEVRGTWAVDGDRICTTPAKQLADRIARYCNLGAGKKLGEMWKDEDPVTGNIVLFQLAPRA